MGRFSRPIVVAVSSVLCLGALLSGPTSAAQDQLPDLVSVPPFDVRIEEADERKGTALRFSTSVANRSDNGFQLVGTPKDAGSTTANQCVSWAAPMVCTEQVPVGTFVWHPEHAHHHFLDFELYELRRVTKSGAPNLSPKGLVASGGKISFCLLDYEPDGPARHPLYTFGNPAYMACATGAQGISPGWRDTYVWQLSGQQILVDDVPDGIYSLVITVDPDRRLLETTRGNNIAATRIELKNHGSEAVELCYYVGTTNRCEVPPNR